MSRRPLEVYRVVWLFEHDEGYTSSGQSPTFDGPDAQFEARRRFEAQMTRGTHWGVFIFKQTKWPEGGTGAWEEVDSHVDESQRPAGGPKGYTWSPAEEARWKDGTKRGTKAGEGTVQEELVEFVERRSA